MSSGKEATCDFGFWFSMFGISETPSRSITERRKEAPGPDTQSSGMCWKMHPFCARFELVCLFRGLLSGCEEYQKEATSFGRVPLICLFNLLPFWFSFSCFQAARTS